MKERDRIEADSTLADRLHRQSRLRLADWHNLPKPRWRDALRALAAPAERMHAYRNLQRRALDVVIDNGCREECR
jgi:hypothetical protein